MLKLFKTNSLDARQQFLIDTVKSIQTNIKYALRKVKDPALHGLIVMHVISVSEENHLKLSKGFSKDYKLPIAEIEKLIRGCHKTVYEEYFKE